MSHGRFLPAILFLLLTGGAAQAAVHIDVLVFNQPGANVDTLPWTSERPLLPCHSVRLRDGSGAEAAFGKDDECARRKGYDPVYAGYAATGPSTLVVPAARLKKAGFDVLVNRGWRQASGGLSPVILDGGNPVAGQPEVEGTLEFSSYDKYVEVTLNLVFTRLHEGRAEYLVVSETRKMKTDEPNYFDHPLLGAVVQVTDLTPDGKSAGTAGTPATP